MKAETFTVYLNKIVLKIQDNMNLKFYFAVFVIAFEEMFSSHGLTNRVNRGLQKVFSDIAQNLMERQKMLTVFYFKALGESLESASFESIASIPHLVADITQSQEKEEKFELETSAIVSLESVQSLNSFNERISFAPTFSMI